ncbi:MAG: YiiX/YebB-like N1pC/P60 family cysteine hydrolase [Nitrospirota bacterium]|nr:YiiX/YebB-like N1pC/P60 family cysteine hydrolase [Nitrospirota bacterium]
MLALFTPLVAIAAPTGTDNFTWQRDELFKELEAVFVAAREQPLEQVRAELGGLITSAEPLLAAVVRSGPNPPLDPLSQLEPLLFQGAALAASHPQLLATLQPWVERCREVVLTAAMRWPVDDPGVHAAIYRVVYGGRTALEEALIQNGTAALPPLWLAPPVTSETPSMVVEGVEVHSGDLLLSRGDAPTSALIARGVPFPGNFSHVAMLHVDPATHVGTVIESLIETGGTLTPVETFLAGRKLRVMVLRPRPGLPAVAADPLMPHRVASAMLERVKGHHPGYDFGHWWQDDTRMFCSEVPYHAYRSGGVELWRWRQTLSSPGLVRWMRDMGVENFTMLLPSDLEYDPQLVTVAEWRNPAGLWQDRIDNAVLDALLEQAEAGARLDFSPWLLPAGWATKGLTVWQKHPAIPHGLTVDAALRVRALKSAVYPRLFAAVEEDAVAFRRDHGYQAPYWSLLEIARVAVRRLGPDLKPHLVLPPRR